MSSMDSMIKQHRKEQRKEFFKENKKFVFASIAIILGIFLLASIGYIMNIMKLSDCDFKEPYKCEVFHTVGLLPPVGVITGWMDFGR